MISRTALNIPNSVAVDADGSYFIADINDHVIRRVDSVSGNISTFAGIKTASAGSLPDNSVPTSVGLSPTTVAIGGDGYLYIIERDVDRISRINLTGTPLIHPFAGVQNYVDPLSSQGYSGDGGPALTSKLYHPNAVAVGKDKSVYIADGVNHVVRMVTPDGVIHTVAGTGSCETPGGSDIVAHPARSSDICFPDGLAIGPDGSVYVADESGIGSGGAGYRVHKLTPDGNLQSIAGNGHQPQVWLPHSPYNDVKNGGPATAAGINAGDVQIGPGGAIFVSNQLFSVIQAFHEGGNIYAYAGAPIVGVQYGGDNGPVTQARFGQPEHFTFGPDGSMYIADQGNGRVRRVYPDAGTIPSSSYDYTLARDDGSEVYEFDSTGRHVATRSVLHGSTLAQLAYTANQLHTITDGDGNVTTINRSSGQVTIVSPHNQTTTVALDANGYISQVTMPENTEIYHMVHSATGLLTSFTKPAGGISTFEYSGDGRLVHDTDGLTSSPGQRLAKNQSGLAGYSVTMTSATGITKSLGMDYSVLPSPTLPTGWPTPTATPNEYRTFLAPDGTLSSDQRLTDGSRLVSLADGTLTWTQFSPDPRFGAAMRYPSFTESRQGSHTVTKTESKTTTPSTFTDPFAVTALTTYDCTNGSGTPDVCTGGHRTKHDLNISSSTETITLPTGRQLVQTYDAQDRIAQVQVMGTMSSPPVSLAPISYTYDVGSGAIHQITQGSRSYTVNYDASTGFVSSTVDATGLTTTNTVWDGDGRPKTTSLPGSYILGQSYDADGNLLSLSTPSSNVHSLVSNAVDLLSDYAPPASGAHTTYAYNFDHTLAQLLDPDGTVSTLYDAAGHLYSYGNTTFSRDPVTGLLLSESAGTETKTYAYDGPLLSTVTVASTGSPAYSKTLTLHRDAYLRIDSRVFSGLSSISYGYDDDGNLTSAGALSIDRGCASGTACGAGTNGMIVSTTLSSVTETPTFDAYGALVKDDYGSPYSVSYTRNAATGRVSQKVETVSGVSTTSS